MKWAVMLLGLALLGAPVAIAQESGASDECRDGETSQQCKERVCKENPDRCRGQPEQKPDEPRKNASQADSRPSSQKDDRQMPPQRECDDCDHEFRFISFDRDGLNFSNYTVGGRLILDSLKLDAAGPYEASKHGRSVVIEGKEWKLVLHDNPTGLISFKGDGELVFDFASSDVFAKGDGYGIKFDGFSGFLTAKQATQDGDEVSVATAAQFHINKPESQKENDRQGSDKVREAIENRKVGAEIKLRAQGSGNESQVFTYDDMEVVVDAPDVIDAANPMRVTVSAELAEGRTIVIDVDPASLTGPELDLHYYDVFDDGTETEIVFRMADSIEDILDATDDAGQPEYWVVEDANGIQVMASIPYWSTHAITIASIGEFVTQPSVLIGIGAGVAGVAIASLTMLRPRRDDL